jgi:hypothetical protein
VPRTNSPKPKHLTLRPKRRGRISKGKLSGGCGRAAAAMDEGKKKWVAWAAAAAIFVVLMLVTPAQPAHRSDAICMPAWELADQLLIRRHPVKIWQHKLHIYKHLAASLQIRS